VRKCSTSGTFSAGASIGVGIIPSEDVTRRNEKVLAKYSADPITGMDLSCAMEARNFTAALHS